MKTLIQELINQYDLNVKKHSYNRGNYYITTFEEQYILRKVNMPEEQIWFIYEAINYLRDNNFNKVSTLHLTKKKLPYSMTKGQMYILQTYKEGQEIDFKEIEDSRGVVKLLAEFHKTGTDFNTKYRKSETVEIKDIYENFTKRSKESAMIKKNIVNISQKTPFEVMFLKDYKVYNDLQKMAISCIDLQTSIEVTNQARLRKTLVHNDYNYHSATKIGDEYYILGIDNCTYSLQILDLSNILTKIMQKNKWDIILLKSLINIYEEIRPIQPQEKNILKANLIFPIKYSGICNKFLQSKRRNNYTMFEVKWLNMLEYQEEQIKAAQYILNEL
ncbi:hypothetical protein AN639_12695 [Candidatus Epulonipiscium fishelsonii]|uniref:Uncharacterized protein n=1 Tax=Candidatus Epulonipiscium fishelsonii TaxID=77094 RepID=A0ACC8XGU0_9FIRM|nr:hypothetical protein AN639_12695 [Epulopiscium sp. SCG-B05WGA-EpuloA1]ONI42704.1 hypothetical protein AN396_13515 [Epulopiscium sp. SCG-B11WGA-EpuloA1]ONI47027.1 hypothetical protein AN644_01875 [Epulopiscium sp. SCG-C06WGA-EpuloA1]